MSERAEPRETETEKSPQRVSWTRFAAASGVVALVVGLGRVGLLALGRAFVNAVESGPIGAIARDVVIVVAAVTLSALALRLASQRRLGWRPALPAIGVALLLFGVGWKRTLRRAPYHDFHGVWTQSPSQSWTEKRPHLPKVLYRHDRNGFRGAGFEEQKAPGVVRVALVGDSFIFGQGVEESETLKARLDEALAGEGLREKVEVLNLGVPGANMATHVRMYAIATKLLGADVVVMGLFEDNDLSAWDVQDEINALARPSLFSAGCFLLDERPAVVLATLLAQVRGSASAVAAFEAIEADLAAIREHDGAPPLIVLDYFSHHPETQQRLSTRQNVWFIPTTTTGRPLPDYHIPNDGHPSATGNRAYAKLVMEKLLATPVIASLRRAAP